VLACTKHTMAIKCSTDSTSYQGSTMVVSSATSSWLAHTNCNLFLSSLPSFASPIRAGKYSSRAWRRLAVLDPPENQRLQSKQKFWTFFRCCNDPTHHAASQPFALASGRLLTPASPLPQPLPSELSASPLRSCPGDH
jgi:hypothetical protein